MNKKIVFEIFVVFLLVSCQSNSLKITNHEEPKVEVDFSPFKGVGCEDSHGYENWYRCEEGSLLPNLGCNSIENKSLLGGLKPAYPIAACTLEINEQYADIPENECIYSDGGFITLCFRYVIYKDGNFQLIKTMDEFRILFAPVESPDEALSFVLAFRDYFAYYGQIQRDDYVYSVKELEDTFIESVSDGYRVHVFSTPTFGCGPFETNAVEIKITFDGNIEELTRHPVFRDPSEDNMCVD